MVMSISLMPMAVQGCYIISYRSDMKWCTKYTNYNNSAVFGITNYIDMHNLNNINHLTINLYSDLMHWFTVQWKEYVNRFVYAGMIACGSALNYSVNIVNTICVKQNTYGLNVSGYIARTLTPLAIHKSNVINKTRAFMPIYEYV